MMRIIDGLRSPFSFGTSCNVYIGSIRLLGANARGRLTLLYIYESNEPSIIYGCLNLSLNCDFLGVVEYRIDYFSSE